MKKLIPLLLIFVMVSGCMTIRQGEVGVKRKFGKLDQRVLGPGFYGFNPISSTILVVPVRTVNREIVLRLPSKEGLTINSEISILYSLRKDAAPLVLEDLGRGYERTAIIPVFRSAAADVTSNFMAKDMHSGQRREIEVRIMERMQEVLEEKGFIIENVLLKSIELPNELSRAIERKLEAEQESERMEYVLMREKREAERIRIQAEGTREAQKILSEGLSQEIIQLRSIEAFKELANSPNAKIIITDGKAPFLIPGLE